MPFFLFHPKAGIQRAFGTVSASVIGRWVHMRTLGYEVVQSNSANQKAKTGWVERGGNSEKEFWHNRSVQELNKLQSVCVDRVGGRGLTLGLWPGELL